MRPDLPDLLSWGEPRTVNRYLTRMPDFNAPCTLLIDGRAVETAEQLEVVNPATGQVFARCPTAGATQLNSAVAAARRAFPAWKALSLAERADRIARLAPALQAHTEPLATPVDAGTRQAS